MIFAIPLMILVLAMLWTLFVIVFPPTNPGLRISVPHPFHLTFKAVTVYSTFFITVSLWLTSPLHGISPAVIAGVPALLLTAGGIIGRRDFNSLDWDILFLIAGGLALGIGMSVTKLDAWLIENAPLGNLSFGLVMAICCIATLILATFMSNTATANITLPLSITLAIGLGKGELAIQVLAILVALSASFAMSLPVSTPPNAIAYASGMVETRHMSLAGVAIGLVGLFGLFGLMFVLETIGFFSV